MVWDGLQSRGSGNKNKRNFSVLNPKTEEGVGRKWENVTEKR